MPGAVRTLAYDALQRPIHIKSQAIGQGTPQTPAGQIIMDYRYTYDAAGNITQRQTEEGSYQYAYDLIDRLTRATPPQHLQQNPITPEAGKLPVEAYSYDPVHNRLSSQHQPGLWQYNQDNQLQSYGVGIERRSYTYTPNGHTATETTGDPATKTREFIYNTAERLIEIKDNNQTIGQYQYDPMGRRIKKHTPEGTTWFLYSDEGLIAEVDPTGNPTRYYGWKPNGLWGTDPLWLADKTTTTEAQNTWQPHLYHNDHLWTPQRLTNTQGEIQWSARSEAFGRTAAIINTINNPLRFPGQYEDVETGLHQNYFRDYSSILGRYVQSDPIGLEDGAGIHLYSAASPLIYFDSLGLIKQCAKGGKKNIGTEGFNKSSNPSEVEKALKDAKNKGQNKRAAALRALLKVIKRGGSMSLIMPVTLIYKERCLGGDIVSCAIYCSMEPWDCESCDDCAI